MAKNISNLTAQDETKISVDVANKKTNKIAYGLASGEFWKAKLTINDFYAMRTRNGIGKKIVVKVKNEMMKKGYTLNPETSEDVVKQFQMDAIASYAWDNAAVAGYCLIYAGYSDIKDIKDYATPAPANIAPDYFYVIPAPWVQQDIKRDSVAAKAEAYMIESDDSASFWVHESRMIRVNLNPEERSLFEAPYNSLDVADNILWSCGQAMWRFAQGFPVLSVKDPEIITAPDGSEKNEVQVLQEQNVLMGINSLTGFIGDERYSLEFKGAEGKALDPTLYWSVVLDIIAMSVNIPKDILRGISAGAVTGSEINLQDFYSSIHYKQQWELQPIYEAMFDCLKIPLPIFTWVPLFEESEKTQAETLKIIMESLSIGINSGIITKESANEILQKDNAKFDGAQIGEQREFGFNTTSDSVHLNTNFVRSQYNKTDSEMHKDRAMLKDEDSALPSKAVTNEKRYMHDMGGQYRRTEKAVTNLMTAFNTDEE